jgi:hypothetical protein
MRFCGLEINLQVVRQQGLTCPSTAQSLLKLQESHAASQRQGGK